MSREPPVFSSPPSGFPPFTRTDEVVVLIHGIWMNGSDMFLLAHRLKRQGFRCVRFRYASVTASCAQNVQRLHDFLQGLPYPVVHFVAHSLGGLLVRQLFHHYPRQKPGRIVTLGSPHQGSSVARRLYSKPLLRRWILGQAVEFGLLGGAPPWTGEHELGNIAGMFGFGVGRLLYPGLEKPNDGTVTVAETYLPGARDWRVIPVSHSGLTFSRKVARQTGYFLGHGRFE
jgi:pimeloyl-ACP methyl ester carboxylesterase